MGSRRRARGHRCQDRGWDAEQHDLPGPARSRLVGAGSAPRRRLRAQSLARLRGGRLGRGEPRRRGQPRCASRRGLARPTALRRLRPNGRLGAGAVDPARRGAGRARPLRVVLMRAGVTLAFLVATAMLLPAQASAEVSASEAARSAAQDPKVVSAREENPGLTHSVSKVDGNWEVAYFADDKEVALAIVSPSTGLVRESWTGYQVAWKMARGYSGAFGHKLNAPYVFLPLCVLFLLGLLDWRRPWSLASLDLLFLLGFGVSHFFFNRAEIGVSVPLQYAPLLYLGGRALWIGLRSNADCAIGHAIGGSIDRPPTRGLGRAWPASWLLVAALFLLGFRVGLNMADSG